MPTHRAVISFSCLAAAIVATSVFSPGAIVGVVLSPALIAGSAALAVRKTSRWLGILDTNANPFHLVFSTDSKKVYCTLLRPAPANSSVVVVDAENWKILKQIDDIGPD